MHLTKIVSAFGGFYEKKKKKMRQNHCFDGFCWKIYSWESTWQGADEIKRVWFGMFPLLCFAHKLRL